MADDAPDPMNAYIDAMYRAIIQGQYDPTACYWAVAGQTDAVWSSAAGADVATSDAGYQAWLAQGRKPSRIGSYPELLEIMQAHVPGVVAALQAAHPEAGG